MRMFNVSWTQRKVNSVRGAQSLFKVLPAYMIMRVCPSHRVVTSSVETDICQPVMAVIPHCCSNCSQSGSACHPELQPAVRTVTAATLFTAISFLGIVDPDTAEMAPVIGWKMQRDERLWGTLGRCNMFKPPDSGTSRHWSLQGCSLLTDTIGQDTVGPPELLFRAVLIECVTDKGQSLGLWHLFQMKQLF